MVPFLAEMQNRREVRRFAAKVSASLEQTPPKGGDEDLLRKGPWRDVLSTRCPIWSINALGLDGAQAEHAVHQRNGLREFCAFGCFFAPLDTLRLGQFGRRFLELRLRVGQLLF